MQDNLENCASASAIRKAKAIDAMKKMQKISVSLGNDKMTLEEINAVIDDAREHRQRRAAYQ